MHQEHVLIAGCRASTYAMRRYTRQAVWRAHLKNYVLLVGDEPKGIELAVVQECRRIRAKVIVAGTGNFPRNYGCKHGRYMKITRDLYRGAGGNLPDGRTARDRWLVDSAQICLFVWDGSDPHVKAAHAYAVQRHKIVHSIVFAAEEVSHG
jgi:hypothetical protein